MGRTPAIRQATFSGGELSPELHGRVDLERYRQSVRLARNFLITPTGAAKNRPGTLFIRAAGDETNPVRLIKFVFAEGDAYSLEFGEKYMRVHTEGGTQLYDVDDDGGHDGGDDESVLSDTTKNWATNQWVGATVSNVTDGSSGTVTANSSTTVTATLSGGTEDDWDDDDLYTLAIASPGVVEIASPYSAVDLRRLKIAQQSDIIFMTCAGYVPYELRRYGATDWRMRPYSVVAPIGSPGTPTLSSEEAAGGGIIGDWDWVVTARDANGRESLPSAVYNDSEARLGSIEGDYVIQWARSSLGNQPQDYNIYRGQNGVYGYIGSSKDSGSGTQYFRDRGNVPDYSDGPPTETDPLKYDITSGDYGVTRTASFGAGLQGDDYGYHAGDGDDAILEDDTKVWAVDTWIDAQITNMSKGYPTHPRAIATDSDGTTITADITPDDWDTDDQYDVAHVATKEESPESYNQQYTVEFEVGLQRPQAQAIWVHIYARPPGGGAWGSSLWDKGYFRNTALPLGIEWLSKAAIIEKAGLVAGSEFKLEITQWPDGGPGPTATTGFVRRLQVSWVEGTEEVPHDTAPQCVSLYEQRLVFGGFTHNYQLFQASRSGDYHNFDKSEPAKDDDGIALVLASKRLDEIRDMVPLRGLVMFTAGAEWLIQGADSGPLTPSSFDLKPHTTYGCSYVTPITIGNSILYVADRSRTVREFVYDEVARYGASQDLSVLVEHLFRRDTLVEWDYADVPFNIVWAIRSDGTMLGLTYLREQKIWAWHRHYTGPITVDGNGNDVPRDEFESVCCIPEDTETSTYIVAKRTIDGAARRYIEIMASRQFDDPEDWVFMDSASKFDGRFDPGPDGIRINDAAFTWLAGDPMTLTTNSGTDPFTSGDVGIEYELRRLGAVCRFRVTAYVSGAEVEGWPVTNVPAVLQAFYTQDCGRCYNVFDGLDHLEGETLKTLADGDVGPELTVSSGSVTVGTGGSAIWAERFQIGIPYTPDLVSLPLDVPDDGGSLRVAKKVVKLIGAEVSDYRGLWLGVDLDTLVEAQARNVSEDYTLIDPENTLVVVRPRAGYARLAAVAARQVDPLPVTISSFIAEVKAGGNQ